MIGLLWQCCVVGLIALACSLALTPVARGFMRRIGAIDKPDPRRVNRVPVPRGGGLAVVVAFFVAVAVAVHVWPGVWAHSAFAGILPWFVPAAVLLVAVGFVDDRFGLPPVVKLAAQIVSAAILCWGGARLTFPEAWGAWVAEPWVYVPLTLVWYIGVVNAFNLIDGLDGLSSGLAILGTVGIAGAFLFVEPTALPVASAAFVGALLGFLRYNYNPASVFLGDSGSLFVGLTVATLALVSRRSDAFLVSMGIPVLCLGVPLIDTGLAVLRRTLRYMLRRLDAPQGTEGGTGAVMTADRDHVHHRFLALAHGNQRRAVWALYGLAAVLMALGFVALAVREAKATAFIIGFCAFAAVIVRAMTNVELWDAGRLLARPGARCGRCTATVIFYVLSDVAVMVALYVALLWLLWDFLPAYSLRRFLNFFLAYSVPVAVAMVLVRAYTRIWGRSTRKDSFMVVAAVAGGSLVSHLTLAYLVPELAGAMVRFHVLWAALLPLPLLMARLAKTAFLQWLAFAENRRLCRRSLQDASIPRVLFYGAGVSLRATITLYEVNVTRNHMALIGVLDDNLGLHGRIFRDLPIFGPLEVLEEDPDLFARLRPTQIVVTTPAIPPARLAEIRAFCDAHGIALLRSVIEQSPRPL